MTKTAGRQVGAATGIILLTLAAGQFVTATATGTLTRLDAYALGVAAWRLGAMHAEGIASTLYVPVSSLEVTSAADPAYECCSFRGAVAALTEVGGRVQRAERRIGLSRLPQLGIEAQVVRLAEQHVSHGSPGA